MKKIKKVILTGMLFLISAILIVLGLKAKIEKETSDLIYSSIREVPPVQTAIVLGASVHSDGRLSPILQDRVNTAFELYRKNKVKNILVSGDHRTENYNEVNAIGNYLMKLGVPEEKILLDHAGFDTYDSMYRSHVVFGVTDAVVVTQDFHLPRTIYIAKHLGRSYKGLAAENKHYVSNNGAKRRELFANFKAVYELIFQKEPTTLRKRL